jgi:acyl dehydratase
MLAPLMSGSCPPLATKMSVNYGFNKVRFLAPAKSGRRIRGHFKLLEMAEKRAGQWQQLVEACRDRRRGQTGADCGVDLPALCLIGRSAPLIALLRKWHE